MVHGQEINNGTAPECGSYTGELCMKPALLKKPTFLVGKLEKEKDPIRKTLTYAPVSFLALG